MSAVQHDVITSEDTAGNENEARGNPDTRGKQMVAVAKEESDVQLRQPRCDPRRFVVEPLAFVYFFAALATMPLTAELLYRNVALMMNATEIDQKEESTCSTNTSDPAYVTQQNIQAVSSKWLMYLEVVNTVPAMLTTLFLGAYSDRRGRKPALLLPLVGGMIRGVISAGILFARLPNTWLLLGYAIDGASGGICSLAMACFSYVADTTTRKERAMRLVMLEVTITLAQTLANISVGYLIQAVGFTYSYIIIMATYIIAFLYALFVVKETVVKQEDVPIFTLDHFKPAAVLFFRGDGTRRRWILQLILLIVGISFVGDVGSLDSLTLYLLGAPICFNSVAIGYFIGASAFIRSMGSLGFAHILSRYFVEVVVVFISCISAAVFYLWVGLATSTILLFLGAVFSGISTIQLVGLLGGYLGVNNLYRLTLDVAGGAFVFYFIVALFCLNALLTIMLKLLMEKKQKPSPSTSPQAVA